MQPAAPPDPLHSTSAPGEQAGVSAAVPPQVALADLQAVRDALDALDHRLLSLLAERSALVAQVGHWKAARGIPIRQPEREQAVYSARQAWGQALGLSPDYVLHLWHAIHEESCHIQEAIALELRGSADADRTDLPR